MNGKNYPILDKVQVGKTSEGSTRFILPRPIYIALAIAKGSIPILEGEILSERNAKLELIKEVVPLRAQVDSLEYDKIVLNTDLNNNLLKNVGLKTKLEVSKSNYKWFFVGGVASGILTSILVAMATGG